MEKQLDRANKAFAEAAQQRELIVDLSQRVELLELAQNDQARKWGLFVGEVGSGRTLMMEQERELVRKSLDSVYLRMQDMENRMMILSCQAQQQVTSQDQAQSLQGNLELALRNLEDRIARDVGNAISERDMQLEQKIMTIVDNQGRDIAADFTDLDRRMQELRSQVEQGFNETSSALIKINEIDRISPQLINNSNYKQKLSVQMFDGFED